MTNGGRPEVFEQGLAAQGLSSKAAASLRFIGLIADEPQIWVQEYRSSEEAILCVRDFVAERRRVNGAGWGAVLDTQTNLVLMFEDPDDRGVPEMESLLRDAIYQLVNRPTQPC